MINLQTIPIERLKPAPYNPRVPLTPGTPGYRRLQRSLTEFSLVQPLVWNEQTGHLVSGHQRLDILKNQGVREVDVVVVALPLEKEKALNVTLNNSLVGSDWDTDKLIDLVAELDELDDFDATLTGFDTEDIKQFLMAPQPNAIDDSSQDEPDDLVRVAIEIPADRWNDVRVELDRLIADKNLTVHVRLPNS